MNGVALAELLTPTLTVRLGKDIEVGGHVRYRAGESVQVRLKHRDDFGVEIEVSLPGREAAGCAPRDLAGSKRVGKVAPDATLLVTLTSYLEERGWYFDWDHIREVWKGTTLADRPDAIHSLHGWTVPQWGEYWQPPSRPRTGISVLAMIERGEDPDAPPPKERRYEDLRSAVWSQMLREEQPETFEVFFQERVEATT